MAAQQQSLDELRAENAKAEEEAATKPQTVEAETEAKAAEVKPEVVAEDSGAQPDAETEAGETDKTEVEDWMTSDESNADKDIPNEAWKAARLKYDAKLEKVKSGHNEEVDRLRAENDRNKRNKQTIF